MMRSGKAYVHILRRSSNGRLLKCLKFEGVVTRSVWDMSVTNAELGSISENNGTYKSVRLLEVSRCESYCATHANQLKYDMSD